MNRFARNAANAAIDAQLNDELFIDEVEDKKLVDIGIKAYFDKLGDNDVGFEQFDVIKVQIVNDVARAKAFFKRIAENGPTR